MKKFFPLYAYGAIITFAGVYLLLSSFDTFDVIKYTLGISLSIAALFAFVTALARKRAKIQLAYHEMHALTMLVYGVFVVFFCNSLETLLDFTAYLFLFYAFSEIIFCTWLFNLKQKVLYKILFTRLLLGLATAIGTVIIMHYSDIMKISSMKGYGVLFIIVGVNILLYVPIMKTRELQGTPDEKEEIPVKNYHTNPGVKY